MQIDISRYFHMNLQSFAFYKCIKLFAIKLLLTSLIGIAVSGHYWQDNIRYTVNVNIFAGVGRARGL